MTDQLQHLFRDEAERIDVPPPPTDAILAAGRARRRSQRTRSAFAIAASVAVVAGSLIGVAGLVADDESRTTPGPADTPTTSPTPETKVPAGPLEVSRSGIAGQPFGADADAVVADVTGRFGEPDLTTGPQQYSRIDGQDGWFEVADDPISPSWQFPVASVSCWSELCLIFGGADAESLQLRGWELAEYRRWDGTVVARDGEPLEVRLAGSGVGLGDSWEVLHAAYPQTVLAGGEGASLAVRNMPWPGIFDGVGTWRLSGTWDHTQPEKAPDGAMVTRMSGGEGPEPGCC